MFRSPPRLSWGPSAEPSSPSTCRGSRRSGAGDCQGAPRETPWAPVATSARGGPALGRGRHAPPQGVLTPRANSSSSTTGSTATNPTPSPDPVHGGGGPALSGRDHINTYEVVTPLICVLQVCELLFFYGFEGRGHVRPGGTHRGPTLIR